MGVHGRVAPGLALLLSVEIAFQRVDGVPVVDTPIVSPGFEVEFRVTELGDRGIVVCLERVDELPEAVVGEPLVGRLLTLGVKTVGPAGAMASQ